MKNTVIWVLPFFGLFSIGVQSGFASPEIFGRGIGFDVPSSLCVIHSFKNSSPGTPPINELKTFDPAKFSNSYFYCSGTLTAPGEVTTAAHCTTSAVSEGYHFGDVAIRVSCDVSYNQVAKKFTAENWAWANAVRFSTYTKEKGVLLNDSHDFAKIKFSSVGSTARPMMIGSEKDFLEMPDTADCRIAGLGRNPVAPTQVPLSARINYFRLELADHLYRRIETAYLNSKHSAAVEKWNRYPRSKAATEDVIDLEKILLDKSLSATFNQWFSALFTAGATAPGDSGGMLYCRPNEKAEWKLYGVTSGGGLFYNRPGSPNAFTLVEIWAAPTQSLEETHELITFEK
ncbi:MAG: trypsin-like serine protease [Cryobacterium sp.]|nr:trypsin-like serine protease [Oligoflexia bacterium]